MEKLYDTLHETKLRKEGESRAQMTKLAHSLQADICIKKEKKKCRVKGKEKGESILFIKLFKIIFLETRRASKRVFFLSVA